MVVLNVEYVFIHCILLCMYVDACICTYYVQIYASQCSPWGSRRSSAMTYSMAGDD